MRADGGSDGRAKDQPVLIPMMSLSLSCIPDGQQKGQSKVPCPSVYTPASALRSLSSVALSSAPAEKTLSRSSTVQAKHPHFSQTISSTFLREAIGVTKSCLTKAGDHSRVVPPFHKTSSYSSNAFHAQSSRPLATVLTAASR